MGSTVLSAASFIEFSLQLEQRRVHIEVHRNTRRRNRLGMTFSASGVLRIDAPPGTRRSDIEATVRAHERWISYRLTRAEHEDGYRTPGLLAGAAHRYLGKLYNLEFQDAATPSSVTLDGEVLRVSLLGERGGSGEGGRNADLREKKSEQAVMELLRAWYRERAAEVFAERLEVLVGRLEWLAEVPPWRQRYMTSQWGSCSAAGRLSLNTHLVKAPLLLVDYVLLHELCHLQHLHHGAAFYALMDTELPGWKRHRRELNGYTAMLRDRF